MGRSLISVYNGNPQGSVLGASSDDVSGISGEVLCLVEEILFSKAIDNSSNVNIGLPNLSYRVLLLIVS